MAAGDQYRVLAAKCDAHAGRETDLTSRAEWEGLAKSYRRLAEQADRNALTDVVYETPPKTSTRQPQQQQQQRQRTDPEDNAE